MCVCVVCAWYTVMVCVILEYMSIVYTARMYTTLVLCVCDASNTCVFIDDSMIMVVVARY